MLDDSELESVLVDDALVTLVVLSEDSEDELLVDDELAVELLLLELLAVDALLAVETLDADCDEEDTLLAVLADVPLVLRLDALLAD